MAPAPGGNTSSPGCRDYARHDARREHHPSHRIFGQMRNGTYAATEVLLGVNVLTMRTMANRTQSRAGKALRPGPEAGSRSMRASMGVR